jgi:hypothetical protein
MPNRLKRFIFRYFWWVIARYTPYRWYLSWVLDVMQIDGNALSSKRILCISRDLFDKDYEQLSYRLRSYGWIWFEKGLFTVFLDGPIPKYARGQKEYAKYLNDKNVRWDLVIDKAQFLIRELKQKKGVCCMITANIDYFQDYALKVACQREGIPVLVLQKEYPISNQVAQEFEDHHQGWDPIAPVVAVAGEFGKQSLIKAGVGEFTDIVVTGLPRLDRYRAVNAIPKNTNSQKITILSFREGYGTNSEKPFFELLSKVINNTEDKSRLLIKAKNIYDERIIRQEINSIFFGSTPENIKISGEIPLFDAFALSGVIVGYNSLSVVEALLTRAFILIPSYVFDDEGILKEEDSQHCSITFCKSEEELLSKIEEYSSGTVNFVSDEVMSRRKEIFAKFWKWDSDQSASDSLCKVIDRLTA